MAVTFSDGFESGNTSAWSTIIGAPTVQSSVVQEGVKALLCTAGQAVSHTIAGGNRTVVLRWWFRTDANPTGARSIIGGFTASSNVNIQIKTTGVVSVFDGATEVDTGPNLTANTWYRADMLLDTTANPWSVSWFVNGADQGTTTIAHAATDIISFSIGNTGTGVTNTYVDYASMSLLSTDYPITDSVSHYSGADVGLLVPISGVSYYGSGGD